MTVLPSLRVTRASYPLDRWRDRLLLLLSVLVLASGVSLVGASHRPARATEPVGAWTAVDPISAAMSGTNRVGSITLLTGPGLRCDTSSASPVCGALLVTRFNEAQLYRPDSGEWIPTGAPSPELGPLDEFKSPARVSAFLLPERGKVVAFTAGTGKGEVYDPAATDPATGRLGAWTPIVDPQFARSLAQEVVLSDGRVLLAGGCATDCFLRSEILDLTAPSGVAGRVGRWTEAAPLNFGRHRHEAALLGDGTVLVVGGTTEFDCDPCQGIPGVGVGRRQRVPAPLAERFHPPTPAMPLGSWTLAGKPRQETHTVYGQVKASLRGLPNGDALVVPTAACAPGSCPDDTLVDIYDVRTGEWRPTGSLTYPRHDSNWGRDSRASVTVVPATAASPDGRVLVAGGGGGSFTGDRPVPFAEIYEPDSPGTDDATGAAVKGAWRPARPMITPRVGQRDTPLADGRILLLGGFVPPPGPAANRGSVTLHATESAEVFDPSSTAQPPSVTSVSPSEGPRHGGDDVKIAGDGFVGVTGVRFGEAQAVYHRVESATEIVATPPPHEPGQVVVTVSTAAGESRSLRISRYTYTGGTGAWRSTGSVSVERSFHSATFLNPQGCAEGTIDARYPCGKVLVVGGRGAGGEPVSDVELFDTEKGTWTSTSAIGTARFSHAAALLADGRVLVTGGRAGSLAPLKSAEVYQPLDGTWEPAGELATARAEHTATPLGDGTVLVVGGCGDAAHPDGRECNGLPSAQLFHPQSGWQQETQAGTTAEKARRARHVAAVGPGGTVLFVGGVTATQVYTPGAGRAGIWSDGGALKTRFGYPRRYDVAAASLPGGKVLVAGGRTMWYEVMGDAQMFDLAAPEVPGEDIGALNIPRSSAPAASWDDGAVIVAGGCTDWADDPRSQCREATATAERYDPVTGKWVLVDPLLEERVGHTATMVGAGQLLVVGGYNSGGTLASAEVFDPKAETAPPGIVALEPPSGTTAGGTEVVIRGVGFLSATTTVTFGGVDVAQVRVRSDRELIAVTPPAPVGPADVVVARNGQRSRPVAFSYGSGAWNDMPPLPACGSSSGGPCGRYNHTATELTDGRILVTGGYEPADCTGSGAGGATGQPTCSSPAPTSSARLFDPATSQWLPTSSMTKPRVHHTATLLEDGTVLIVGGDGPGHQDQTKDDLGTAELYDPRQVDAATGHRGAFRPTTPLSTPRSDHSATLLEDGDVLVAGGWVPCASCSRWSRPGRTVVASAERYDSSTGSWLAVEPLEVPRSGHAAVRAGDGSVLVIGGCGSLTSRGDRDAPRFTCKSLLDSLERYRGTTWEIDARTMGSPRAKMTANLVRGSDGRQKVLVAGGCGGYSATDLLIVTCTAESKSTELYDPATRTWARTAPMHTARGGHSASVLPDGRVLVVGSGTYRENPGRSAELFDPAANSWQLTSFPNGERDGHTATALKDGRVFVVGGAGRGGFMFLEKRVDDQFRLPQAVPSAELYTPAPEVAAVSPTAGPSTGGTSVRITGRHLEGVKAVSFGNVALATASFTLESPTEIVATTPAHPGGKVPVVVTTPGGLSLAKTAGPYQFTFVSSGVPGTVGDLSASPTGETSIDVRFMTAGSDGVLAPPATRYVVKQSRSPIADAADFAAAETLCGGECVFPHASMGHPVTLGVAGLTPGTTYHYAVRAVGSTGTPGPMSDSVSATTHGVSPAVGSLADAACPDVPAPRTDQVRYSGGYSMVGLPAGTMLAADSQLFSWFDQGARGAYSLHDPSQLVGSGRGYWAWFSCPKLVKLSGNGSDRESFALGAYHASMVGNPSGTGPAAVRGHDFAARWDPALNDGTGGYVVSGYREPQVLEVGGAMWVFAYRATGIELAR